MITGRRNPELGGDPKYLDIVGLNYYFHNQWWHPSRRKIPLGHEKYRPLNEILQEYASELQAMHIGRWGELNTEFHMVLYQHARQPRSLAIVANLLQESDRHTRLQLSLTHGMERAAREHAELLKLCTEGKISAACTLLKTHIEDAGKSLRSYLEEHQKASAKA